MKAEEGACVGYSRAKSRTGAEEENQQLWRKNALQVGGGGTLSQQLLTLCSIRDMNNVRHFKQIKLQSGSRFVGAFSACVLRWLKNKPFSFF